MSDPFSAASDAVGIISLGIQVSQGLVKYCSQVKNFTSEIATFKAKAESIDGILQNLESVLKKTEREQKIIPNSVVLTLNGCEETLKKLNEGVGGHGKDRLSNRLTYFVRDDLAAACNMLDSLQHNLSNALQVWIFKQQLLFESPSLLAQRCSELNAAKAESSLLLLKYEHNFRLHLHSFTMFFKRDAGRFSIGPLLSFSATAPGSSPAFRLFCASKYRHPDRRPYRRASDGRRWVPSEYDVLRMHPEFDSSGKSNWDLSGHVIKYDEPDKVLEQLEELVNHTLNDLRILFQSGEASPKDLDQTGETLSELIESSVVDMPIILEAIFLQSEKALEFILSQDPSAVNEILYKSQETPLHVARTWPEGLSILIRAGAM
ncbi:hypothetical protein BCON_0274g00020 [Botryotinia convoluta]|uniref:Fungal N-terminal domain-containing protein n=1 Tax=Botryotinia convoluta TaxID=54673 RepID=A0A4Z1HFG8_9HELO|nr:hypothetical protein BCON_0274g00020 [Botryotinia convoluta]